MSTSRKMNNECHVCNMPPKDPNRMEKTDRSLVEFLNDNVKLNECISKSLGKNKTIVIDGHSGVGKTDQTISVLRHCVQHNTRLHTELSNRYHDSSSASLEMYNFYSLSMCYASIENNMQSVYTDISDLFKTTFHSEIDSAVHLCNRTDKMGTQNAQ